MFSGLQFRLCFFIRCTLVLHLGHRTLVLLRSSCRSLTLVQLLHWHGSMKMPLDCTKQCKKGDKTLRNLRGKRLKQIRQFVLKLTHIVIHAAIIYEVNATSLWLFELHHQVKIYFAHDFYFIS
mmetsp:Transcript_38577/g.49209  ORF Transcript_38577/g.49209 Transcript_38577/m.49209 type:complete len:123 (+) Transcript_38577:752-1120(+)